MTWQLYPNKQNITELGSRESEAVENPYKPPMPEPVAQILGADKPAAKPPTNFLSFGAKPKPVPPAEVVVEAKPEPAPAILPPYLNTAEITKRLSWLCQLPEGSEELNRYFPNLSPLRKVTTAPDLFDFQRVAMPQLFRTFIAQQNNGLLIAPTGSGKTFVYGHGINLLRAHAPERFGNGKIVLAVTKPSIIIQTQRVLQETFRHRDVWVTSYDQLRTTFGAIFIDWTDKILENGDIISWPVFTQYALDTFGLVIFDECQSLKNEGSVQTRIALSLANTSIPVLLGSATPYSRPVHTRATVALVKPYYSHQGSVRVTNRSYPAWLSEMCGRRAPEDWSPSSMKRIQESIEPFTIRMGKVKYKHKTLIKQVLVDLTADKKEIYDESFNEYQEKLMQFGKNPLSGFAAVLVAQLKFRQKSELLRTDDMAALAEDLEKRGKNVIIACSFADSLRVIRTRLIKHHGYKEEDISIIMGGQPARERQDNIDKFQEDKAHIMLLMFQAGGAGLSLHQYEGANKRPRHAILPPVWNAEEMVQVLGRAHRCNSDSTTHQWVVWYRGTIEEQVAAKLKRKLASMKEVVRTRETWVDLYAQAATNGGVTIDVDTQEKLATEIKNSGKVKGKKNDDDDDDDTGDVDFEIEEEE